MIYELGNRYYRIEGVRHGDTFVLLPWAEMVPVEVIGRWGPEHLQFSLFQQSLATDVCSADSILPKCRK